MRVESEFFMQSEAPKLQIVLAAQWVGLASVHRQIKTSRRDQKAHKGIKKNSLKNKHQKGDRIEAPLSQIIYLNLLMIAMLPRRTYGASRLEMRQRRRWRTVTVTFLTKIHTILIW